MKGVVRYLAVAAGAFGLALLLSSPVLAQVPDFYWEEPVRLSRGVGAYPQVVRTAGRVVVIWQENQRGSDGGQAWLSLVSYAPDGKPASRDRFAGPFTYSGEAPVLFSAADDGNGTMTVAASSGERSISLYRSLDGGLTFGQPLIIEADEPGVAPRIFSGSAGGWYLFITRSQQFSRKQAGSDEAITYESLSIFLSRSADGTSWSPFAPFVGGEVGLDPNFLPSASSLDGADVVVFQTLSGGARPSYQLYSMTSADGGATWSQPVRVTTFADPIHRERPNPDDFDNQRPHLARIGSSLWLAWERRLLSGVTQVYTARVGTDGLAVPGSVERVTLGQGNCSEPRLFATGSGAGAGPSVSWFDDRRGGSRVYTAFRSGNLWSELDVSGRYRQEATFGRAVHTPAGLYAFWQVGAPGATSVIGLAPDTTVSTPRASSVDFSDGKPTRRSRATITWNVPQDSSGILGFSYLWSRDPGADPPKTITTLETDTRASFTADEDGDWYFAVRAQDYAGNWSEVHRIRFIRDTTPPGVPLPLPPLASADGFLASNTFALEWDAPAEPDVAGYTWALEYLGPLDRLPARQRARLPGASGASLAKNSTGGSQGSPPRAIAGDTGSVEAPTYVLLPDTEFERKLWDARPQQPLSPTVRTTVPRASFSNLDDGYWAFSVAAIDGVGNIGDAVRILLRADKFVPYTTVADVSARRDAFGAISLTIVGRGFSEDGAISRLVVDLDGKEPWDRDFSLDGGGFSIVSDRLIRIPEIADLEAGSYRIGLYHPVRGWYLTRPQLAVDYSGTYKFGDLGGAWKPTWTFLEPGRTIVSITTLFMIVALTLPGLGMVLSLRQVLGLAGELRSVRSEVQALMEEKPMPTAERQEAARSAIRKGAGLAVKFTLTISLLVIFIVMLVSVPLGVQMLGNQSETLARGLEQRARVLLESAAQGGKSYLPARNVLELSLLPNQASAIEEASYITITGYGTANAVDPDVVWASNDPDLASKLDGEILVAGQSLLRDTLSERIPAIASEINGRAEAEVASIAEALAQLQDEGRLLAARLDAASQARLTQVAASARDLERTLSERLAAIADASVSSEPAFDPATIATEAREYIFYKPILFRQGRESVYYRGLVRLSVSTETIVNQIRDARVALFRSVGIVAAIALGIGVLGAFGLASIITRPLMKVVDGIKKIRDTEDMKSLHDFSITVKTRDELALLAGTINEMTAGLVKAAKEAEFLTVGKSVQKMFIPLEVNSQGEKLTTGYENLPTHSFFGYYEGAKGVSGDYFDYRPLDDRFYAFIKCDVSGKGVPAALIMVGVATIFTTGFQGWSYKKDGIHLDALTERINDYLYKKGFKGLFAALVMGVFDSKNGDVHLCHAGDKFVRVYKPATREVVQHELQSAPAAGAIDPELVSLAAAYKQVTIKLDHGDSLLLYTDGFEESSRARRGRDFRQLFEMVEIKDAEGKINKHREDLVEQLGEDRIKELTIAIMTKSTYTLRKQDDPLGPENTFDFDFSALEGTSEDLVIGLAAAEKVFRIVPDPSATPSDLIIVDSKIDDLLSRCWKQYPRYCAIKQDHPDPRRKEYRFYGRLREDEQYDDLTMMLIRRN